MRPRHQPHRSVAGPSTPAPVPSAQGGGRPDCLSQWFAAATVLPKRTPMTIDEKPRIVGGGAKKLLYTVATIRKIGVGKAAKALTAKNTCKACAYGMGGQKGGMTN